MTEQEALRKRRIRPQAGLSIIEVMHGLAQKKSKFMDELRQANYSFTVAEKQAFLRALKENGLDVIFDIDKVREYLPHRREDEIKYLINSYQKKACQNAESKERSAEPETPLEFWMRICNLLLRCSDKKQDSSVQLLDIMEKQFTQDAVSRSSSSKELESTESTLNDHNTSQVIDFQMRPDEHADEQLLSEHDSCSDNLSNPSKSSHSLQAIYEYLRDLMEGKYPVPLSAQDSILLLAAFDILSSAVQTQKTEQDTQLILSLFQRYKHTTKSADLEASRVPEDDSEAMEAVLAYFDGMNACEKQKQIQLAKQLLQMEECGQLTDAGKDDSSTPHMQQEEAERDELLRLRDKSQNPLFHYSCLPKMKRIQQTLNPLHVPIGHLQAQQSQLIENDVLDKI